MEARYATKGASQTDHVTALEANKIIESITACVDRGEDKGKCHVFLDHSDKCQCGDVDLTKERMK